MRLIDADELIKTVNGDPFVLDSVKCYVRISAMKQPVVDAVEVVRCKDCKHKHLDGMPDGIVWLCPFGLPGGENFFCGYGAKDGEEE